MTARRFGLDRLMTRARLREEQAQRIVADSRRGQDAAEAAYLHELERFQAAKTVSQQPVTAADFRRAQELASLQARSVAAADVARQRASTAMQESHEVWQRAAREKRTFERLDERDRTASTVASNKAAQRALDDLTSTRRRP